MHRLSLPLFAALLLALAVGCQTEPKEAPAPDEPAAQPAQPAAAPEKADPMCAGAVMTGEVEKVDIGGRSWELNGSTLKLTSPVEGNKLIIGALTDIKETSEDNKKNLATFVDWLKAQKVDLVVVAGDSGETKTHVEEAMDILSGIGVPVLNIIGNREGKTDYREAMVAARAKSKNIFDLNVVRRVDTPVVDIVSLPGYFDSSYIHNDDGCLYFAADVAEAAKIAAGCDSPVLLVSHGGPLQDGPDAIDRTAEGANVGDPELAKMIATAKIPFGIFGNIHEAGGRATDASGKTRVEPGVAADSMFLNPGPADGVRWGMNDGSESIGMAATMTIENGKATYALHRIGDAKVAKKGKKKGKK